MNVFGLRDNLISDYEQYIKSFFAIRDPRIKTIVDWHLSEGALWPDPLLQLNPSFERGRSIDELVAEGVLHQDCRGIFKINKTPEGGGQPLRLHLHQEEAIRTAVTGGNYALTTGTGSGKSLAYIVPIVDHVLRTGSRKGLRAIVVYPMNALANSQKGELQKFLESGFPKGHPPVTFERYTGQEDEEERARIIANPPDILLTNFVMLELILTRPYERPLVEHGKLCASWSWTSFTPTGADRERTLPCWSDGFAKPLESPTFNAWEPPRPWPGRVAPRNRRSKWLAWRVSFSVRKSIRTASSEKHFATAPGDWISRRPLNASACAPG